MIRSKGVTRPQMDQRVGRAGPAFAVEVAVAVVDSIDGGIALVEMPVVAFADGRHGIVAEGTPRLVKMADWAVRSAAAEAEQVASISIQEAQNTHAQVILEIPDFGHDLSDAVIVVVASAGVEQVEMVKDLAVFHFDILAVKLRGYVMVVVRPVCSRLDSARPHAAAVAEVVHLDSHLAVARRTLRQALEVKEEALDRLCFQLQ